MTTDVIIIGAGPNGLLMACELALAGIQPVLLDALPARPTAPKANGLVGQVVQAMDYRGLYERFTGSTRPPEPMPAFEFGALPLALNKLDRHSLYALPLPQRELEALLEQRADELGVHVRRGHEVVDLQQDADQVTIRVNGQEGPYTLSTRYLIGADGAHSLVRKRCGIGFPGYTDTEFVGRAGQVGIDPSVADQVTGELTVLGFGKIQPTRFTRTDRGMVVVGMFQPGVFRVAVYEWRPVDESVPMSITELRDAAGRVLGAELPLTEPPNGLQSALRRSTEANSRQADRYRAGRVFLVGDAAHVFAGIGGPGMNLGMQDVLNLAWKLAATLHGWAPDDLLDTYHAERHPVGARVITQTRAQTALLSPGTNITAVRDVLALLLQDEVSVQRIADLMAGADVRYPAPDTADPHPMTGGWMPDLQLDGTRVAELLRDARPVLLDLAGRADLTDVAQPWTDRIDVVRASTDAAAADAVLIRPDGYVAWAARPDSTADDLLRALHLWFGKAALTRRAVASSRSAS